MAVAVAVAVAVTGGGAVAVAVAGLTKRSFNHIQKNFSINVWSYGVLLQSAVFFFFFRYFDRTTDPLSRSTKLSSYCWKLLVSQLDFILTHFDSL